MAEYLFFSFWFCCLGLELDLELGRVPSLFFGLLMYTMQCICGCNVLIK